jgi:GNAT superfamily N-acetyltransferase
MNRRSLLQGATMIRACRPDERDRIFTIVNAAAEVYRGAIPADCWHEPYMSREELEREIAAGVEFSGYEEDGELIGVMGIEHVKDVDLIRHAYVLPGNQGKGIGTKLLGHLEKTSSRPILIGTWRDAVWAIEFYERHGYQLVPEESKEPLLRKYWRIPDRQVETSVVLEQRPAL